MLQMMTTGTTTLRRPSRRVHSIFHRSRGKTTLAAALGRPAEAFASIDGQREDSENWDSNFEGELLTIKGLGHWSEVDPAGGDHPAAAQKDGKDPRVQAEGPGAAGPQTPEEQPGRLEHAPTPSLL